MPPICYTSTLAAAEPSVMCASLRHCTGQRYACNCRPCRHTPARAPPQSCVVSVTDVIAWGGAMTHGPHMHMPPAYSQMRRHANSLLCVRLHVALISSCCSRPKARAMCCRPSSALGARGDATLRRPTRRAVGSPDDPGEVGGGAGRRCGRILGDSSRAAAAVVWPRRRLPLIFESC